MWLELAGGAGAWLAHATWYWGRAKRRGLFGLRAPGPTIARCSLALSWLLLALSLACWVAAHGAILGVCCALFAWTAAASCNAVTAPLAPRAFLSASVVAALSLSFAIARWLHGA